MDIIYHYLIVATSDELMSVLSDVHSINGAGHASFELSNRRTIQSLPVGNLSVGARRYDLVFFVVVNKTLKS